jgi:hypothetical protein
MVVMGGLEYKTFIKPVRINGMSVEAEVEVVLLEEPAEVVLVEPVDRTSPQQLERQILVLVGEVHKEHLPRVGLERMVS